VTYRLYVMLGAIALLVTTDLVFALLFAAYLRTSPAPANP